MSAHRDEPPSRADRSPSDRPRDTYVLVHGAYHGGWCWAGVAERLRALGHVVHVPTLTGLGERSHLMSPSISLDTFAEDVAQLIRFEGLRDIILVGHSFGGSTISAVADRMPERLRHLVYLDALVLASGESSADRSPERIEIYRRRAMETSGGVSIPPMEPRHYGITDPDMAAWLAERLTPHPLRTYYDRLDLRHPLGNGVPATYIACSDPYFDSVASSRERVKTLPGWRYREIPTAHNAMMLMPDELTEMLVSVTSPD